mmetsp:Transcript_34827/g.98737  ORF Transcript_34827/g.98737 Transcript_34827/m.98737 type:complete len:795 (-) Transcript_34827:69-2453(-)|eukprot:CAMPEP_0117675936 /NCGR_PEP_ID=MMETSP0804-20121206/15881_1 /TAXON_ID=1074897 /ORGANISM="Tetraselmis astigmatica, Strain CCMP880" /LENGTH=794 /DNA_ID=CAMNT_0005484993 /DNA_START=249 /DNA_END=2633 /DNA_ORIENTATION=-
MVVSCSPLLMGLVLSIVMRSVTGSEQDICGAHGDLDSAKGTCTCHNPYPPPGERGWMGSVCDIEVFGAAGHGEDETVACRDQNCHKLEADDVKCFSMSAEWNSRLDPWNFLTVQLNRTSAEGDPDMYGVFWGGVSGQSRVVEKTALKAHRFFDFQETSSSLHPLVTSVVNKAEEIGLQFDYSGVYLCIHAYGQLGTEFSLRASTTACPSRISQQGELLMCSTPVNSHGPIDSHYSQCIEGTCQCDGKWKKPNSAVYPGLGFEDCSASILPVEHTPYEWLPAMTIESDQWAFIEFNITADDYEVAVMITSEDENESGFISLFAKADTPPGSHWGQFDVRNPQENWMNGMDYARIQLSKMGSDAWRTGTWYAGAHNAGTKANYVVEIVRYNCPANCNGRGYCSSEHICHCTNGFFKEDCSGTKTQLEFDRQLSTPEPVKFEMDFFDLPNLDDTSAHVEVSVTVKAWVPENAGGFMPQGDTAVVLLKGSEDGSYPTLDDYTISRDLNHYNEPYTVTIASSLLQGRKWTAMIYNKVEAVPLGYSILVSRLAYCPNGCTSASRGECGDNGQCACKPGWMGVDCSMSSESCTEGTFRGVERPEDFGTCWQQCSCHGGTCDYEAACKSFTCNPNEPYRDGPKQTRPAPLRLRKVPGLDKCVEDECLNDQLFINEKEGYTCNKRCICEDNFGMCKLSPTCELGTTHCLSGRDGTDCSSTADGGTRQGRHAASGLAIWMIPAAGACSFVIGAMVMMALVIHRDKKNNNSLHIKSYRGIDLENMDSSMEEPGTGLLSTEVHTSP